MKNVPTKLRSRFCGTFVASEIMGQQPYRLMKPPDWLIHDVFRVSLLKQGGLQNIEKFPGNQLSSRRNVSPDNKFKRYYAGGLRR